MVPAYLSRRGTASRSRSCASHREDETAASMLDAFERAMTPRTKLLLLSHVSSNRGTRLPMRDICAMAHSRGALVGRRRGAVGGHIAFDVREMGCDFLALPGHKWLLGPDGAAALYVRPDTASPAAVGRRPRSEPPLRLRGQLRIRERHDPRSSDDAQRTGARSGVATSWSREAGMPAVEGACMALADRFVAGLCARSKACASRRRSPRPSAARW